MSKKKANERDLRIDVIMIDNGRRYRVTHIPSGVHIESESVREAIDRVNAGMEEQ